MESFQYHVGVGVPLLRSNVDTDQIIPADYLKRVGRSGFEDGLFSAWRDDADFVLNDPAFADGSVLVAGPDFGTGSSREHAVWALQNYGFRVVISSRFGDIFRTNAGNAGLLAAQVPQSDVEQLWALLERRPGTTLAVDLRDCSIRSAHEGLGVNIAFDVSSHTRTRLLHGLDDIELTLRREGEIAAFESRRPAWKPTTSPSRQGRKR